MERKRPRAVIWYEVYCHLFGVLNLITAWEGYQIARDPMGLVYRVSVLAEMASDEETVAILEIMVGWAGWCLVGVGLAFGIAAFTLPRTPDNRKTWTAHLVHLVFGMGSGILLPLCLPVFVGYLKPEVKAYYGFSSSDGGV